MQHDRLQLRLWVNGELKQNANTSDMIWPLAEQISAISNHVTLDPGDVILRGRRQSRDGVRRLSRSGRIDAEIDGLGRLSVEIVADQPFASGG